MSKPIDTILDRRAKVRAKAASGSWRQEPMGVFHDDARHKSEVVALCVEPDAAHIAEHACPVRSAAFDALVTALDAMAEYAQHTEHCHAHNPSCTCGYQVMAHEDWCRVWAKDCSCGLDVARDNLQRAIEALEATDG